MAQTQIPAVQIKDNDIKNVDIASNAAIAFSKLAGVAASSHVHATADITTGTFDNARIAVGNVTQHVAAIDHDALLNFVANKHIDWTGASANFSTTGTGHFADNVGIGVAAPSNKLDITGHIKFSPVPEPTSAPTPTLAGAGAGNVDDGEHFYWMMFVTAEGQTGKQGNRNAVTVADKSVDGQVDLTNIPISSDPNVTARKIFRSKADQAWSTNFLLTTINDNITTTYTDNTSDANLGSETGYWVPNTTAGKVFYDATVMIQANDISMTSLGIGALGNYVDGVSVVAIGGDALFSLTTGNNTVAIGNEALRALTTTQNNVAIGNSALRDFTAYYNMAIGPEALRYNVSGWHNVAVGYQAGKLAVNASNVVSIVESTLIGSLAKPLNTGDTNEIVIGYDADGIGSNTVVLGNDSVLITALKGDIGIGLIDPEAPLHIKIPDSDGGYLMEFETGTAQKWRLQQKGTGGTSTIHLMAGGNRTFHLTCSDFRIYKYTDQAKSFIMTAGDVDGNNGGNFLTTSSSNHTFELHNSGSGRYDFRLRNGNFTLDTGTLLTDVISEANSAIGVTIDGLLIKDGIVELFQADNGFAIHKLPKGDGATGNTRWYLIATLPTNSYRELSFQLLSANNLGTTTGSQTTDFQITTWLTNTPVVSFSERKSGGGINTPHQILVTDESDGTIKVYTKVARYGDASVIVKTFTSLTDPQYIAPTEEYQGSAIPSAISGDVIFDTLVDPSDMILGIGTLLTDVILETTSATGVTIDGLLIKDGVISASGVPDGSDATALHDNVGSEIFAIINKTVPDPLDVFLIEDEGSGYDKSRVTFAQVEAALNHDSLSGFVGDEHLDWTQSVGTIHTGNYIQGGAGTDGTAIHDNTASEISAITEKATPVAGDFILIEDSAASNVKKRILIGNLPVVAPSAHKDSHDPEDGSDPIDTGIPGSISVVVPKAEGTSHTLARSDHVHQVDHSIVNNHIVTIDSASINSGEYTKFTASGLESKTFSELRGDINVADGADVTASNTCDTPGGAGTDTTAIHDNVANEIASITNKATPIGADYLLIEDSIAANAKKHITITNLEAMLSHDALADFVADEHLDWTVSQAGMRFVHNDNINGIDQTVNVLDGNGMQTHNFTFTNGVLTAYSLT